MKRLLAFVLLVLGVVALSGLSPGGGDAPPGPRPDPPPKVVRA